MTVSPFFKPAFAAFPDAFYSHKSTLEADSVQNVRLTPLSQLVAAAEIADLDDKSSIGAFSSTQLQT